MTREELLDVLTCYEGAIQNAQDSGEDADILELAAAREALMEVLLRVKEKL